jgi:hypothetical protein
MLRAIFWFIGITGSISARANYNSILIGDQAAGMGGAYTALFEDASALAWYNPATLAKLHGMSFSAAVGIYKKFDTLFNSDEELAQAGLRANQGFFRALPSSTGSVVRYESFLTDWTLALSIVTPIFETFKGEIASDGSSTSTLGSLDESLWVGVGAARRVSAAESLGFTLYYTARNFAKTVTDRQKISETHSIIYNEEKYLTQNAMVGLLGYHLDLSDRWKLGISARLSAMHLYGKASYAESYIDTLGPVATSEFFSSLDTRSRIPAKYALGLAYLDAEQLITLALDINYYTRAASSDFEGQSFAEYIESHPVWNISLGGEIGLRQWLKLRAGVFTNFSPHPNPDPLKVRGQGDRVDQLGWSANAALIRKNLQYTFGGYYTGGWGRSVQRVKHEYIVIPKQMQTFTMLVGTSYHF